MTAHNSGRRSPTRCLPFARLVAIAENVKRMSFVARLQNSAKMGDEVIKRIYNRG
jgi:hypothetical protein